ncbi:hypothetical protein ACP275_13G143400 [Erythranthe tilingii]
MALLMNREYGNYSKLDNEDPEETQHRLAQFLIYKAMQRADSSNRRRPSWLRVKMFKLKIKFGKRLRNLKKGLSANVFSSKGRFCKQISSVLKSCKHLLHGKQGPVAGALPPIF